MSDSQRAVICPGPSFAGANLSGKRHLKSIHWENGDFRNCTFLLEKNNNACYVFKIVFNILSQWAQIVSKRAQKCSVGWATCIAWFGSKGGLFEITFVIYIHALALVEHHPSFHWGLNFLPRLTVSYCVSYFPDRLYRICNWQMGVGRFLGFLQVLMAVQWLLGTIWWSSLAHRETQKSKAKTGLNIK